jgi:pimeloyl-ACP methyl ester carboxylesterase
VTDARATVVLVHGAWAGSWIWGRVLALLEREGVAARAVDLPSCGAPPGAATGLAEDEAAVRRALDDVEGEVVLCGHSYGGMVITGSAVAHDRVGRLLYLCAFMPDEGESLLGMFDGRIPSHWRVRDDLMVVTEPDEKALAASDLEPEDQLLLASKRVPQSLTAYTRAPTGAAWRDVPSTYAVCTNDASLPVALQRSFAERASDTVELPTGHHPMLTRPELVAELLARLAGAPAPAAATRSDVL